MKLPAILKHGITINADMENGEPVLHVKGSDSGGRSFVIRLSEKDLDLLRAGLEASRKRYA